MYKFVFENAYIIIIFQKGRSSIVSYCDHSTKHLFCICLVVYCLRCCLLWSLLFHEQIREPLLAQLLVDPYIFYVSARVAINSIKRIYVSGWFVQMENGNCALNTLGNDYV